MTVGDEKIEREKAFHNSAFQSSVRHREAAFYSVWGDSLALYERLLNEHGGSGTSVLEYGCGQGSHAFFLAERGAHVLGIDISDVAIQQAQAEAATRRLMTAEFRVMNAETLDLPPGTFDLICGSGILHHLDLERAYPAIARVLRPSGVAVFLEPLGHNPLINLYRRLTPDQRTSDEHPLLRRDFDLARRYFGQVETAHFHLSVLAAVPLRRTIAFGPVRRALGALDGALFSALPLLRHWAWIVVTVLKSPRPAQPEQ